MEKRWFEHLDETSTIQTCRDFPATMLPKANFPSYKDRYKKNQ